MSDVCKHCGLEIRPCQFTNDSGCNGWVHVNDAGHWCVIDGAVTAKVAERSEVVSADSDESMSSEELANRFKSLFKPSEEKDVDCVHDTMGVDGGARPDLEVTDLLHAANCIDHHCGRCNRISIHESNRIVLVDGGARELELAAQTVCGVTKQRECKHGEEWDYCPGCEFEYEQEMASAIEALRAAVDRRKR
jgi:hypothetical protein